MTDKPELLVRPCVVVGDYPLVCNLRNYRVQRSLSEVELARKVQLNPQAISDLEKGRASPTLKTAFKLADALGVEITDLYARNGQWEAPKAIAPLPPQPPVPKKRSIFGVSTPRVISR